MKRPSFVLSTLIALVFSACSTVTVTKQNDFTFHNNVVYGTAEGTSLVAELYIPQTEGPKPAVVVVHGGGWDSRAGDMHEISRDLAVSGFVVLNITYRLAPESLYPKAIVDVKTAIAYLRQNASKLQVNPDEISGWGYSAGANLILMVGLDPKINLKAIVSGGTPADFLAWPVSPIIQKYLGVALPGNEKLWAEASPVNHVEAHSPAVFLYHGHLDHLVEVDQMYIMRDALQKKNVEVETYESPLLGHIFTYLFSNQSLKRGVEFLVRHTRHPLPIE
jgi:acetyl esterase/lipase